MNFPAVVFAKCQHGPWQKRWRLPCRKRAVNLRKMWYCLHLLVFTDRKIQGFPIVLLSVNLSIRSIIRYFPVTVNPRKHMFSGIYRSVDTWRMSCLPVFTDVFRV